MKVLRRRSLAVLVASAAAAAGCGDSGYENLEVVRDQGPPLLFGVLPFLERETLAAGLRPLTEHLSLRLGRTVRLRIVASYGELDRLASGERLDLGWLAPREGRFQVLCRPAMAGEASYRGLIVARKGSGLAGPRDLVGRRVAFVDRNSKSGFLEPVARLAREGLDPLRDFAAVSFAGNHDRALAGVLDGSYDAAAVTDLLFRDPAGASVLSTRLAVLASTDPIAPDPIVVRTGLGAELAGVLRTLLLDLPASAEGRAVQAALRSRLGIEAFRPEPPLPAPGPAAPP